MDTKLLAITIKRSFTVPAESVFDAWLDPDVLGKWMFDPVLRGETILRLAIEARVGGSFSFRLRRAGKEIEYFGEYLEIDRPRRLAFTWAVAPDAPEPDATSRVVIEIVPQGKACDLTLVQEMPPEWEEYAEKAKEAWTQELRLLGRTLTPLA